MVDVIRRSSLRDSPHAKVGWGGVVATVAVMAGLLLTAVPASAAGSGMSERTRTAEGSSPGVRAGLGAGVPDANAASSIGGTVLASVLNVRAVPFPRKPGTGWPIAGKLRFHARVTIDCWEPGAPVSGLWGSTTEWDHIVGFDGTDTLGFASDGFILTGGDTARMVRQCY
jgi:hypothetical protein